MDAGFLDALRAKNLQIDLDPQMADVKIVLR
jgi:hypothetical protein